MSLDKFKAAAQIVAEIEELDAELESLRAQASKGVIEGESARVRIDFRVAEPSECTPEDNRRIESRLRGLATMTFSCTPISIEQDIDTRLSIHATAAILDLIIADKKVKRDGLIRALESLGFKI
jgi:hypothetical protein